MRIRNALIYLLANFNRFDAANYLTLFKLRSQRHRIADEDGIDIDFNVDVIEPSNKFCQQLKQLFGRLCEYAYVSSNNNTNGRWYSDFLTTQLAAASQKCYEHKKYLHLEKRIK